MEQRPDSPQPPTPLPRGANDPLLDDFDRPEPPQVRPVRTPPKRDVILAAIGFAWKTLVFPAVGLAYLTFCYVCHCRIVRISGTADPVAHLSIIKAGVTSISILIVSLSLLPLYSLISDLKSEEFFRLLSTRHQGVPLKSINNISTPSYGIRDSLVTLYHRHASIYFIGAFFASLLTLATSALAPAVLSVGTALFDGDLVALSVGAIRRNSFLNMSDFTDLMQTAEVTLAVEDRGELGGNIAWAEFSLGLNYSFQSPIVDQTTYIIPTPAKLSSQTRARWISDVIAMRPACEWIAPDIETPRKVNFSDLPVANDIKMNLTSKNIQVPLIFGVDPKQPTLEPLSWGSIGTPGLSEALDLDALDVLTNGATVFSFIQCATGCHEFNSPINVTILPELHTTRLTDTNGDAVDISLLYCDPKAEIQTRQITQDGRGALTVGDKASTSQGNLHPVYTTLLLSYALTELKGAGPGMPFNTSSLGNQVQFSMVFGNSSLASTQISTQPTDQITRSYASILQSAMKPFMDGTIASAYVPARATRELPVFVSSPPHLIASAVLYVLLTLFALACHFRRHAAQFTFFAVASRLAGSDIPPSFAGLRGTEKEGFPAEDAAVSSLKKTRVFMEGGEVLNLRNDI